MNELIWCMHEIIFCYFELHHIDCSIYDRDKFPLLGAICCDDDVINEHKLTEFLTLSNKLKKLLLQEKELLEGINVEDIMNIDGKKIMECISDEGHEGVASPDIIDLICNRAHNISARKAVYSSNDQNVSGSPTDEDTLEEVEANPINGYIEINLNYTIEMDDKTSCDEGIFHVPKCEYINMLVNLRTIQCFKEFVDDSRKENDLELYNKFIDAWYLIIISIFNSCPILETMIVFGNFNFNLNISTVSIYGLLDNECTKQFVTTIMSKLQFLTSDVFLKTNDDTKKRLLVAGDLSFIYACLDLLPIGLLRELKLIIIQTFGGKPLSGQVTNRIDKITNRSSI